MAEDTVTREAALAAMYFMTARRRNDETHTGKAEQLLRELQTTDPDHVLEQAKAFVMKHKKHWPNGCACYLYRHVEEGVINPYFDTYNVAGEYRTLPHEVQRVLRVGMPYSNQCWCLELEHECECRNLEAAEEERSKLEKAFELTGVRVEPSGVYHRGKAVPIKRPDRVRIIEQPSWMNDDPTNTSREDRKRTLECCEEIVRELKKRRS